MKLTSVVTLASPEVRLRFIAMERSLRATGCDLPLRVIPYNKGRFELPPNAEWWLDPEMDAWLCSWKAHPMMRKYQCLTIANFQFIDSDVIFLRNPAEVLSPLGGFVTSCGHWRSPAETLTEQSMKHFAKRSTNWQASIFNAGQWACDSALFTLQTLREHCESEDCKQTCLTFPHHDQPGVNLLVLMSGVSVNNLTLPPWNMESTWAGDYLEANYERYWKDLARMPYLIHWAGCAMSKRRPIDELMERFLTADELRAWRSEVEVSARRCDMKRRSMRLLLRRLKSALRCFGQVLLSD